LAHLQSLLQDRHAWSHLLRAASALLPHQRPPTCMRVVSCLAYARACRNESSRPSVLRHASDPRRAAPASTSAWMKGSRRAWLHLAPPSSSHRVAAFASPPLLPACRAITASPPLRGPWSACIRAVPSTAFSSTASGVLHVRLYCSRADPPAAATLQLLPYGACSPCTPSPYTLSPCTLAQLLLLFLLPDPRSLRPCRAAPAHARAACASAPRLPHHHVRLRHPLQRRLVLGSTPAPVLRH
jgi:hypothetical protein